MTKPDHSCCYLDCQQGRLCPLRMNRECAEDEPDAPDHSPAILLLAALGYVVAAFALVVLVAATVKFTA